MGVYYVGNPTATQAPSPQPGQNVLPSVYIPADTEANNSATMFSQQYRVLADFIGYLQQQALGSTFGDGSDGNVTVSTVITLTRDMFYNTLTLASSGQINCGGFRVYVKTLFTTQAGNLGINADGAAASGVGPGTAGAAGAVGTVLGGAAGGAGASNSGTNPNSGGTANNSLGGAGGIGSTAASQVTTTGSVGTANALAATLGSPRAFSASTAGSVVGCSSGVAALTLISGGAGGGGGGAAASNWGGSGGAGGGVLVVVARQLAFNAAADIHANGGAGSNSGGSGGGGGGGGGGGVVILAYASKNAVTFGAGSNCVGGVKGTGGNNNAGNGSNGTFIEIPLS